MTNQKVPFPFLDQGVTQVAWVVEDVERAVHRFHGFTGVGPWSFYHYNRDILTVMKRNGEDTEYDFLAAVTNAGPTRLKIIQPISDNTIYRDFVRDFGYGGIQHLGLAIQDMEHALGLVRAAGLGVIMEGGGHGPDGDGYFAYLDTVAIVGTVLELMERPKRRRPPYRTYPQ